MTAEPAPGLQPSADAAGAMARWVIEFAVLAALAAAAMRTFVAETYVVPTGSMATGLLGHHKAVECPGCGMPIDVGFGEQERIAETVACPNCLYPHIELESVPATAGDRLLVLKGYFDYRDPARWEPAVFACPHDPRQAWIKRVVGLPGESVEIRGGDVYVDGNIARKTWEQFLSCRVPVYSANHFPRNPDLPLPLRFLPASEATGWRFESGRLLHDGPGPESGEEHDRIEYVHRDSGALENCIRDESPYNADRPHWDLEAVSDIAVSGRIERTRDARRHAFELTIGLKPSSALELQLALKLDRGEVELSRADAAAANPEIGAKSPASFTVLRRAALPDPPNRGSIAFELGYVDRAVWVRINGANAFDPVEMDEAALTSGRPFIGSTRPAYFECRTGNLAIADLRIDRDIHYIGRVPGVRRPAGVGAPIRLAADQFFVLGDNSAISSDSRAWDHPAVPRRLLIGKPVLAHHSPQGSSGQALGVRFRIPDWPFRGLHVVR